MIMNDLLGTEKPFEYYELYCFGGEWTLKLSYGEAHHYTQRKFEFGALFFDAMDKIKEIHSKIDDARRIQGGKK